MNFNTIPEALEDLRQGKIILVTDDPDRENEMCIRDRFYSVCDLFGHRNVFFSLIRFALFCSLSGCSFGDIVFPVTGLDEHGDLLSGADLARVKGGPEKVAVRRISITPVP